MKNYLLFVVFSLFIVPLHAQIVHEDFGSEGLRIALNENLWLDLDDDGYVDFIVNSHESELGFAAFAEVGCMSSPSADAYTSFGSREIKIFEKDQTILIDNLNMFDYIDGDRGAIYDSEDGVFADGWENGVDQYIGFALVKGSWSDGWMRIAVDTETNELIIYEYAYLEQIDGNKYGIVTGATEVSSVQNIKDAFSRFELGPNPTLDFVKLDFSYEGDSPINLAVMDISGKEIYAHPVPLSLGRHQIEIQAGSWSEGIYYLQLRNSKGVEVRKISVTK